MKLNLDHYSVQRKPVQKWYRDNSYYKVGYAISMWAATSQCPAIAVAFFLAEDLGYIPEIVKSIDTLIKHYGYVEILGQKEGSPYLMLGKDGE